MKARSKKRYRRHSRKKAKDPFFTGKEQERVADANVDAFFAPSVDSPLNVSANVGGGEPEKKEEKPSKDPAAAPATDLECKPIGMSRKDFIAKTGDKSAFGLTRFRMRKSELDLQFAGRKGSWRLKKMKDKFGPLESFYTGAGEFIEDYIITDTAKMECPRVTKFPRKFEISKSGAAKIAQAEKEHCSDFQLAYQLSIKKFIAAANGLAEKKTRFSSKTRAKRWLEKTTGVHPDKWFQVSSCLLKKTLIRDHNRSHKPRPHFVKITYEQTKCKFARFIIHSGSLPKVGKVPSSAIVKGCGEK